MTATYTQRKYSRKSSGYLHGCILYSERRRTTRRRHGRLRFIEGALRGVIIYSSQGDVARSSIRTARKLLV